MENKEYFVSMNCIREVFVPILFFPYDSRANLSNWNRSFFFDVLKFNMYTVV